MSLYEIEIPVIFADTNYLDHGAKAKKILLIKSNLIKDNEENKNPRGFHKKCDALWAFVIQPYIICNLRLSLFLSIVQCWRADC